MENEAQKRLTFAISTALEAGKILLRHRNAFLDVHYKKDKYDPVTLADQEVDAYIRSKISEEFSTDYILSEENKLTPKNYDQRVWMIDPLDDTKAFIDGFDSFSISIGCVNDGRPEIGVVFAPAREEIYYTMKGKGAFEKKGKLTKQIFGSDIPTLSKSRVIIGLPGKAKQVLDELVQLMPVAQFIEDGSIALAIARIAAGEAECTICTNPRVSKWDSAGGQAILEEVGGVVTDIRGLPLNYKQVERGWPHLVVASANPNVHADFIEQLQKRSQIL